MTGHAQQHSAVSSANTDTDAVWTVDLEGVKVSRKLHIGAT